MAPKVTAYDMGKFWRLVTVDGGLVTGTFWVSLGRSADSQAVHVKTVDVVVWADERRSSGRVLYSDSLTAFIEDGEVRVPEHMIREQVREIGRAHV